MLKIGDDSPLPDSWSPSSWRPLKAKQQPVYSDEKALCEALATGAIGWRVQATSASSPCVRADFPCIRCGFLAARMW